MIAISQKTIIKSGLIEGIGLHDGLQSKVFFRPGKINTGILFFKHGKPAHLLGRDFSEDFLTVAARCSSVGSGAGLIMTVEHILAAVMALGITNLEIDVHGQEIPGLDGSSAPFVDCLKNLGILEQNTQARIAVVKEPIFCHESGKAIAMYPADYLEISYVLDYNYPYLRGQKVNFNISSEVFEFEIAPARTFCTQKEAEELKNSQFGRGATLENTVIVKEDGLHQKNLRFPDECARHKVLDILGDLSLLGQPVFGRIFGIRSGHTLNRRLVNEIRRQNG